jgi:hypothetical protein
VVVAAGGPLAGYDGIDGIANPEVGHGRASGAASSPRSVGLGCTARGARPMHQAAKRAGTAALGGSRGEKCPTTTPTLLPSRMTCGGCLMAMLSRAEFAASTIVSSQAVLVGCGA